VGSELLLKLVIGALDPLEKNVKADFSDIGEVIGDCFGELTVNVSQFLPVAQVYKVFMSFLPFTRESFVDMLNSGSFGSLGQGCRVKVIK
jgi:hypothetical protein